MRRLSPARLAAIVVLGLQLMLAPNVFAADVEAKLEKLNQREKQLLEKLEAVQQRQRHIQTQLEEVRRRKQSLLNQKAVRQPGQPEGSPAEAPTP